MYPWDGAIARLRWRLLLDGAAASLVRVIVPGAAVAVAYVVLARRSPWAHFFAPYVGAAYAVACLGAIALGIVRTRHSRPRLAKMIDLESKLMDRLASAVEFAELPERDPFQQYCIDHLKLNVPHTFQLHVPRIPSRRRPWIVGSVLILAGAVGVHLYRPRPVFEIDAGANAKVDKQVLAGVLADVNRLGKLSEGKDPALTKLTEEATSMVRALDRGELTRLQALGRSEHLREQAATMTSRSAAVRELSSAGVGGSVGALARALENGDVTRVQAGMTELATAMESGAMNDEEQQTAAAGLAALATAMGGDPELSASLSRASKALAMNDLAGAAAQLRATTAKSERLAKQVGAIAAANQTAKVVDELDRSLRGEGARSASGLGGPDHKGLVGDSSAGAQSGSQTPTPASPRAEGSAELRLHGQWNGKVVRQLFDAPSTAPSDKELEDSRAIFVEHRRVVEERFQQDEIPLEYKEAVRAYFTALAQKESQWNQTRK